MEIVLNNLRQDHAHILKGAFAQADEILISIAYFKIAGFDLVRRKLVDAINRRSRIRLFCGLDFWITDPAALRSTLDLFDRADDAKLYLCRLPTNFHPKLYCSVHGGTMTILIGSANLSRGGLRTNLEVSAVETVAVGSRLGLAVRKYFNVLEKMSGVVPATRPVIRMYEREHAIRRRHSVEAERKAKEEIAELEALQPAQIKHWLARYLRDETEQAELRKHLQNYNTARTILERLTRNKVATATEFTVLYNRLVGGGGHPPLWPSGGLSRARESVIQCFQDALEMFRALRSNLRRSPDTVFETGLSHASVIPGMGPNVISEALTTWNPRKYAVLNRNPVTSLRFLGLKAFPTPGSFTGRTYADFTNLLVDVGKNCGFDSLIGVNHFLNYVYWRTKGTA